MDKKMQVRIPNELYDQFKKEAKDNAQTPSLLVRKWIEEYVENNKK
ncbi:CopG family transcriptional regulator [Alteribacillus sp. YIM 98480]|nr:CopG family transcriptional regulator [Alteribacillus sp. YIM 98480]